MMTASVIQNLEPLQPDFLPARFHDRNEEHRRLKSVTTPETVPSNLHLYGPQGTGKTHLTRHVLNSVPGPIKTCLIRCEIHNTQYKVLKQLCQAVTGEETSDGYHSAHLKRLFENRTSQLQTVVVLDQVEFLLLNDGNDLLYYLSRIQHDDSLCIITVSDNLQRLKPELEERTYSTLSPEVLEFDLYPQETVLQILEDRADQAFFPDAVERTALTYIATSTENVAYGLQWLKTAAENADTVVTEDLVRRVLPETDTAYAAQLLHEFSVHHKLLYEAVVKLTGTGHEVVYSGDIYTAYEQLTVSNDIEPLSERRVSDFLKHLELLQLIEAEYHYGGDLGKTREIRLADETG